MLSAFTVIPYPEPISKSTVPTPVVAVKPSPPVTLVRPIALTLVKLKFPEPSVVITCPAVPFAVWIC